MEKDKINYLEPPEMLFSETLLDLWKNAHTERSIFRGFPDEAKIGRSNAFYGRSPIETAVGVQMQLEQSEKILTSYIKVHRSVLPFQFPQIVICEHVPKKVVYLRPLRRKSSRRWVKKWTKRGWKVEIDQILTIGDTRIMSQELHDRLFLLVRQDVNKKLQKIHELMQREFMLGFWGGI